MKVLSLATRGISIGLCLPGNTFAMPTVSGNNLTWSSVGWHQVQHADTYATVCEGNDPAQSSLSGGPCIVEPGNYIVINHTSGERYENITVDNAPHEHSSVVVESDRISWPNDGWYQVQRADTYATVCEGGAGCDVSPGNYIVINHTTGQRFDGISVGRTELESTIVAVEGNTIIMPSGGWYQVQNATTLATICEGAQRCEVSDGSYHVINHTTSQRWDYILVSASTSTPTDIPTDTPSTPIGTAADSDIGMAFLAPYGAAPYGNLPLVDNSPWLSPPGYTIQAGIFPDDCMLERYGLQYCYQPSTRQLMTALSSGEPLWSFALPGDNATNRIDGMELSGDNWLTIVATTTQEFGYPSHEMSHFTKQGEFLETIDLFKIDGITWPIVNIQGEPLIVGTSQSLENPGTDNLRLIGNVYELSEGGNRSVPNDWFQTGVIEAIVDPATGSYLDIEICRNATMRTPSLGPFGLDDCGGSTGGLQSAVSVLNSTINDNTGSGYFNKFAKQIIEAKNVIPALGISTDLMCINNLSDTSCLLDQVPTIGAFTESSSSVVACSTDSWDAGYTGVATAQLTQRLIRSTSSLVELHEEFTFAHRCPIPSADGVVTNRSNRLTGNATLVSTIDLASGEVIARQTQFSDLTSIIGTHFLRFYDGIYQENILSDTTNDYQLLVNVIDQGYYCSRSCGPYAINIGEYQNYSLNVASYSDGENRHFSDFHYTNLRTDESSSVTSDINFLSTNNEIDKNIGFDGYAEKTNDDGTRFRIEQSVDFNFPGLDMVTYSSTDPMGIVEKITLPLEALTDSYMTVLEVSP